MACLRQNDPAGQVKGVTVPCSGQYVPAGQLPAHEPLSWLIDSVELPKNPALQRSGTVSPSYGPGAPSETYRPFVLSLRRYTGHDEAGNAAQ